MTEEEWLACRDPAPMLEFLRGKDRDRQLRLFGVACCRAIPEWSAEPLLADVLATAEQYADGDLTAGAVRRRSHVANTAYYSLVRAGARNSKRKRGELLALTACLCAVEPEAPDAARQTTDRILGDRVLLGDAVVSRLRELFLRLLRDIFGNPFRPVTFSQSWRTDTALTLARTMYESRDFSAMPILADALQDAGCDSALVLDHCRGPEPHVRGCWVVDLVLGKR